MVWPFWQEAWLKQVPVGPSEPTTLVVASCSISQKILQRVLSKYKGYKWQCLTTHCPPRQHTYPRRNFEVDKVTPPPPPPEGQGVGKDKGGEGAVQQLPSHHAWLLSSKGNF